MTSNQIPIQWKTEALSPGLKLSECQADHIHLLLTLRMNGSMRSLLYTSSWHVAGTLYFYLYICERASSRAQLQLSVFSTLELQRNRWPAPVSASLLYGRRTHMYLKNIVTLSSYLIENIFCIVKRNIMLSLYRYLVLFILMIIRNTSSVLKCSLCISVFGTYTWTLDSSCQIIK
jgi:hypothetical protein